MMFTLLLVALAVSGVGALISRRSKIPGQIMMVVGIVSLVVVAFIQLRQIFSPSEAKTTGRVETAVSVSLATFVMNDLSGQTGTVVLLFPPRGVLASEAEESYENGFVLPLRHTRGAFHLKAVLLDAKPGKDGYDLATFQQALQQTPDALAVVSYAGVPAGFAGLFAAGQPKVPNFYVFDSAGTTNWLSELKSGQVRAVVLPRPGVDQHTRETASGNPQEIFDQCCVMATPDSADQVVAQLSNK